MRLDTPIIDWILKDPQNYDLGGGRYWVVGSLLEIGS